MEFVIGEHVKWMTLEVTSKWMRATQHDGIILKLIPSMAVVRLRNNHTQRVALAKLRHAHEPGPVTELFERLKRKQI